MPEPSSIQRGKSAARRSFSSPTVVDLFSGCGGISLGFQSAGFDIRLGVDFDEAALGTFRANFGEAHAARIDLSDGNFVQRIQSAARIKRADIVVAGPPCQGFSLTGPRNFDDPRNKLYLSVFEAVKSLRPKAFVIENVRGMSTLYGGAVRNEVIRRFEKLGYATDCRILCAADYGVPQLRHRLFFVGIQGSHYFDWMPKTHGDSGMPDHLGCAEAISDLPSRALDFGIETDRYSERAKTPYQRLMRRGSRKLFNHVATNHKDFVKQVISLVPPGGDHRSLPKGVGEHRKFNEAWTRYHPNRPSFTVDTGHRNHFHYEYNRVPTVRENARLQSFPDRFRFTGTRTNQNRQVGNAVPPMLAQHFAKALLNQLDW
jgi:DNA (cytosine-5)-methyltransferase 1